MSQEAPCGDFERGCIDFALPSQLPDGNVRFTQLACVAYIPAFQTSKDDFRMELQRQSVPLDGECLIWINVGRCEMVGAARHIEGVAMPVEETQTGSEEF